MIREKKLELVKKNEKYGRY